MIQSSKVEQGKECRSRGPSYFCRCFVGVLFVGWLVGGKKSRFQSPTFNFCCTIQPELEFGEGFTFAELLWDPHFKDIGKVFVHRNHA